MNWYILQIKPNAHKQACKNLKRQGFEVFLPLMIKTLKKGSKFVNKAAPLFPSYLFMGSNLDQIPWKSVNATRGVSKALSLDGTYRQVDIEIIEGIKSRCDKSDVLREIENISPGDRVKIESGPFTEFIGHVDKIEENQRAWILIEILKQQTRAKVARSNLSKVS